MKKINLFKTFDVFFRLTLLFLFVFVWCRYYINNFWLATLVTLIITVVIEVLYNIILNKKNKNQKNSLIKIAEIEKYINTFVYGEQSYTLNFFLKLACSRHNASKKSDYIIIEHPDSKIILYPKFMYREFNADDLIYIHNKVKPIKPSKIIICTNTIDSSALKICSKLNINIVILDYMETFKKLLEPYNLFPTQTELKTSSKQTIKQLIAYALNKKRTKSYFLTSVLLLFCSFLVPYKLYYVIMSSILLVLSFISFSNVRFNKNTPIKLLDI